MNALLLLTLLGCADPSPPSPPAPTLVLPAVVTGHPAPTEAIEIAIGRERVWLEGEPLVALALVDHPARSEGWIRGFSPADQRGQLVAPLYDALVARGELPERARLQIDRDTPFAVVRDVMYTAGQAKIGDFDFAGRRRDGDLAVVESALPAIGPPSAIGARPRLSLVASVTERGYGLASGGRHVFPGRVPTVPCRSGGLCGGPEDYDHRELGRLLAGIRADHPEDDEIVLSVQSWLPFGVMMAAMDAVRADAGHHGDAQQHWLFPHVVVAGRYVEPAPGASLETIGYVEPELSPADPGEAAGLLVEGAFGEPVVIGGLSRTQAAASIAGHAEQIAACGAPAERTEVVVQLVIEPSGAVSSATLRGGEARTALAECAVERAGQIAFDPLPGEGLTILQWPFAFGPG